MRRGRPSASPYREPREQRRRVGATAATLAATLAAGGLVAVAGGGEAFWLALPLALALAAAHPTPRRSGLTAVAVIAAALGACARTAPPASLPLAVLVPAATVALLLAVRERLVRQREALRHFASTDPLTGAANRRSLLERIDYEIARHRRARRSFTLVMLDLDGFKLLNDRFGHAAGDDLLTEVAAALGSVIRDQDTVARIGGDEFCVLAPETDAGGAQRLAARVMTAVERVTAGIDALGASPGVAVFPHDGSTPAALLEAADEQLLAVKRRRRAGRARRRAA